MKPGPFNFHRSPGNQNGSAVLVLIVILSLMVALIAINSSTLNWLQREVKQVDRQETGRLAATTNLPPTTATPIRP